ncbi:MAG: PaaI family thioesterase [Burkholderiaceae bacterium]|nr:PaaI family thioesterase [Burkholderiaceae bacterium]
MTMTPDFERRVRESFARQPAMRLIGAELERVEAGEVEISLPFRPDIAQQHGFVHAGIIGAALDSACGYAALSTMPAGTGVLTIEYKLNCLAPAAGERFRLVGRVRKAGRTIVVAEGDAIAVGPDGQEKLVSTMSATVMTIRGRDGVVD